VPPTDALAGLVEEVSKEHARIDPTFKDGRGPLPVLKHVPRDSLPLYRVRGHDRAGDASKLAQPSV
jgi:hypothetical protein